jgi:segregation and condensation protein B
VTDQVPTSAPSDTVPVATPSDTSADSVSLSVHQRVEAVLLTSDRALSTARIGLAMDATAEDIEAAIEHLNEAYASSYHVMRIQRVAGGWRMQTTPDVADVLQHAAERRSQHKLSPAALETLSIIAYRQPVMRAEVEAIRGVACGEVLRGLMERRLLRIAGRAEELGRPMLYGTTRDFLRIFGLGSLDDLPDVEGLDRRRVASGKPAEQSTEQASEAVSGEASGDGVSAPDSPSDTPSIAMAGDAPSQTPPEAESS